MEEDQTVRFSLRIPKEMHERLTQSANESNQSLNGEIMRLLNVALSREQEKAPDRTLLEQLLPPALIWRINRFRTSTGLPSNEETAKRLLKIALDEIESTKDILDKLSDSYKKEKDLRILARDVIAAHSSVARIEYGSDYIWFRTKNGESGAIDKKGKLYYSDDARDWDCGMEYYSNQIEEWAQPSETSIFDNDGDLPF